MIRCDTANPPLFELSRPNQNIASRRRVRGLSSSVCSDSELIDLHPTGTTYSMNDEVGGEIVEDEIDTNKESAWLFGEEIPGLGQYDDFHTIDWLRDTARDRMRHR